jgi:hypothetical protein
MLKVELHHLFFEPNDFHNKKGNTHQSIEKEKKYEVIWIGLMARGLGSLHEAIGSNLIATIVHKK